MNHSLTRFDNQNTATGLKIKLNKSTIELCSNEICHLCQEKLPWCKTCLHLSMHECYCSILASG